MPKQAVKFQVGDQVRSKSKDSPAMQVVKVHGLKWVKTAGGYSKTWWPVGELQTEQDWQAYMAAKHPTVPVPPVAAPLQLVNNALTAAQTSFAKLGQAAEAKQADKLTAELMTMTGLGEAQASLVVAKFLSLYSPPAVVPPAPTTLPAHTGKVNFNGGPWSDNGCIECGTGDIHVVADCPAYKAKQPADVITKTQWVAVVPGTLKLGDLVSYPPYKGYTQAAEGHYTAEVVSLSGKAWAKLDAKPQWHQVVHLFRAVQTKQLASHVPPTGWAPATPDWKAWTAYWTPWRAKLNELERISINNYTGAGYLTINTLLRSGQTNYGIQASTIKNLDAALAKGVVPFDVEVFRAGSKKFDVSTPIGSVITDPGYVSTSTNKAFALNWHNSGVFMTIRVPKGSRGAFVQLQSSLKHEFELLLPRGSQFRLLEVQYTGKRVTATLELL